MQELENLNLLNDFLFFKILENEQVGEEFGRTLLEIIFNRKFGNLKIIPQKVYYGADPSKHGVRLDVYLDETLNNETLIEEAIIADIEPESKEKEKYKSHLPKRVRFYHSKIDANILSSGNDYTKLKKVIVVMIMPFDPFGYDQILYTIQNKCLEVPELPYDDGAKTMFLYTRGSKGNVSENIKALLYYMEESTAENATSEELKRIHNSVSLIKQRPEVSREFMKWAELQQMWKDDGYESGHSDGLAEGRTEGLAEGRAEGLAEGRAAEFKETVLNMSQDGMSPEAISRILKKDLEEVESVLQANN